MRKGIHWTRGAPDFTEFEVIDRDVVACETGSSDSVYWVWKRRLAQKGRVRVGPIERRSERMSDVKALRRRRTTAETEVLDEARRRLGFERWTGMSAGFTTSRRCASDPRRLEVSIVLDGHTARRERSPCKACVSSHSSARF
jgi:hypothetical protein